MTLVPSTSLIIFPSDVSSTPSSAEADPLPETGAGAAAESDTIFGLPSARELTPSSTASSVSLPSFTMTAGLPLGDLRVSSASETFSFSASAFAAFSAAAFSASAFFTASSFAARSLFAVPIWETTLSHSFLVMPLLCSILAASALFSASACSLVGSASVRHSLLSEMV